MKGYDYLLECDLKTFKKWVKCARFDPRFTESLLSSYHTGSKKEFIKIMENRASKLSDILRSCNSHDFDECVDHD